MRRRGRRLQRKKTGRHKDSNKRHAYIRDKALHTAGRAFFIGAELFRIFVQAADNVVHAVRKGLNADSDCRNLFCCSLLAAAAGFREAAAAAYFFPLPLYRKERNSCLDVFVIYGNIFWSI